MKIAYVTKSELRGNRDEAAIAVALAELGHEVVPLADRDRADVPADADLLLFHHWYNCDLDWFRSLPMPKVGWFFDKAWHGREQWLAKIAPLCGVFCLTDGDWAAGCGLDNVRVLRQGISVRCEQGKPNGQWPDIVFPGTPYAGRVDWVRAMERRWGRDFGFVQQGVYGQDMYDLCETAKVIVAPQFPCTDRYCSNRVYVVLGAGGFLLHPKLKCLNAEFKDGVHYVGYTSQSDLDAKISYYLAHPAERDAVRRAGQRLVHGKYTYKHRVVKLMQYVAAIRRPALHQ